MSEGSKAMPVAAAALLMTLAQGCPGEVDTDPGPDSTGCLTLDPHPLDMGEQFYGERVYGSIQVTNACAHEVVVSDISVDEGRNRTMLFDPVMPTRAVPAGGVGELRLGVEVIGISGSRGATITLWDRSGAELASGMVIVDGRAPRVILEPDSVILETPSGCPRQATFELWYEGWAPTTIQELKATPIGGVIDYSAVHAAVGEVPAALDPVDPEDPAPSLTLPVVCTPGSDEVSGTILLRTSLPEYERVVLTVTCRPVEGACE